MNRHKRFWQPDTPGVRAATLAPGMMLQADDGFACLPTGTHVTVKQDSSTKRALFVTCDCERHYLLAEPDGRVAGFQRVDAGAADPHHPSKAVA